MSVLVIPAEKVFEMHDTYGFPFEISFELMYRQRVICDLRKLFRICVDHGWNPERTKQRIRDAWADVFPVGHEAFVRWADG